MNHVRLGRTDIDVSRLCLGTGGYGSHLREDAAIAVLEAFLETGGTFVDTANVYGRWALGNEPLSERLIGRWLDARRLRDRVVLATKGGCPDIRTWERPRLAKADLTHDLHDSLLNLKTDRVDFYWLHHDDPSRPIGEIVTTLNGFIESGLIRYFGCSNWSAARVMEALEYGERHRVRTFDANQTMFNLAAPNMNRVREEHQTTLDDAARAVHVGTGLPLVAYTSQAGGFFSLFDRPGFEHDDAFSFPREFFLNPRSLARARAVDAVARRIGADRGAVALAYVMHQPFQVIPIVGPRTPAELATSVAALEVELSTDDIEELEGRR